MSVSCFWQLCAIIWVKQQLLSCQSDKKCKKIETHQLSMRDLRKKPVERKKNIWILVLIFLLNLFGPKGFVTNKFSYHLNYKHMWDSNSTRIAWLCISSLHWPILGFLYAFFVQWSLFPIKLNSYPHPTPTHSFHILSV